MALMSYCPACKTVHNFADGLYGDRVICKCCRKAFHAGQPEKGASDEPVPLPPELVPPPSAEPARRVEVPAPKRKHSNGVPWMGFGFAAVALPLIGFGFYVGYDFVRGRNFKAGQPQAVLAPTNDVKPAPDPIVNPPKIDPPTAPKVDPPAKIPEPVIPPIAKQSDKKVEAADPAKSAYRIDAKPIRRIKATLTVDIVVPKADVAEWFLYAPKTPTMPNQRDVKTSFFPAATTIEELSFFKRPLWFARIADGRRKIRAEWTIEATLMSRHLVPLQADEKAPAIKDLAPNARSNFTRTSQWADFDSKAFRSWLNAADLKRKANESDLDFARRVFAHIKRQCEFESPTKNHAASSTAMVGKSDAGGLSSLFVAALRADGIPARLLAGRLAESDKPGDPKGHIKAEFHARGIGWIPVDLGTAVKRKKSKEFAHFGHDGGNLIVFAIDQDFVIDSFVVGEQKLPVLQGVVFWYRGGGGALVRGEEKWTVAVEPIP